MRLDQELVKRNFYQSRTKAVAAIEAGLVFVNGVVAKKPSHFIAESDVIIGGCLPYSVGRGSLKLQAALDEFGINPSGLVCLDVGASTGGFTEVLLTRGATRVYAVDVGTNQLAENLRADSRVISMEKTDIRALPPVETVGLIVVDVSFVSLTNIIEVFPKWGAKDVVVLIKPQFEVPRDVAAKFNGVIKSQQWHNWSIERVKNAFEEFGCVFAGLIKSPVLGGSGNTEFLARFKFES